MKKHFKFDENYYITQQVVNNEVVVEATKNTNHIFVVDVSGSMSSDLPKIKTQLKNKLPSIMRDGDTISIVWFSGKNDAGILKEEVEIKSLKTFTDLNNAIDKWLKPIGLTAFHKPLVLVEELIKRIKNNRPNSAYSLIFLTDGCNNDCSWSDVIKSLKSLENDITSSSFIEYGFWADSKRLTEMASVIGGEKISCDGFDDFEPIFNSKISTGVYGGKKTLVEVNDEYLYDFVFSITNDGVLLYNVTDGKVLVNSDVKEIYFFSKKPIGVVNSTCFDDTVLYASIYVLSDKLLNEDSEKIFYALGDNFYYKMLSNAFGKQKLNSFKSAIKDCIGDVSKRFIDGRGNIQKIDDNSYCIMNLIEDLGNMDVKFYPNHEHFNYNRIGRKKISAATILTDSEKKLLSEVNNVDEANNILKELSEKKVDVKFKQTNPDMGYSMTDVVWNEERANLSVRIYIEGEAILPTNKFNIDKIASFKYRTYTLIKDGIINVTKLPVNWSIELQEFLTKNNVVFHTVTNDNNTFYIVIDLTSIPIINRGMIKNISANSLAKLEYELFELQAHKKVYDYFKKSLFPKTSKSFIEILGEECASWLKDIGITDYNGFAPKLISEESTDFYMSVNLITKIKGLSSLPKVEDVLKKIYNISSLTLSESMMSDAIIKYLSQTESETYLSLNDEQQKGVLRTYLTTKSEILNNKKRKVMQEIAQIKFSLILSKKWFVEFNTFDDNKLDLTINNNNLNFTFLLTEKEEKI